MANNRVELADGTVLMDISDTTAEVSDVAAGKAFYSASGVRSIGTGNYMNPVTNPTANDVLVTDANGQAVDSGVSISDLGTVKSVNGQTGTVVLQASDVGALPDNTDIPANTSDLTNDSGFITGMVILSYGNSNWQDFIEAYTAQKVVYCRASSNSNPASGSQTRLAFMAYVNNAAATSITEVEFQYYRSVSSHTVTQQGDQVYVYKLNKNNGWSVLVRENYTRITAGTNLEQSYKNGVLTLGLNSEVTDEISDLNGVITSLNTQTNSVEWTPTSTTTLLGFILDQCTRTKLPFSFVKVGTATISDIPSEIQNAEINGIAYGHGDRIVVQINHYATVLSRLYQRTIYQNSWRHNAWACYLSSDQVTAIASGGTGATNAWDAKTNLGVGLNTGHFVVQKSATTINVVSGSIFICFMDGGIFQLSCTNAGITSWRVMVQANQNFTVDVSVANKIIITAPSNAATLNWICFDNKSISTA